VCSGQSNKNNLGKLLSKLGRKAQLEGIALLQEAHIVDGNLINLYRKMNFVSSCVSTKRGGVTTLYDNSFECVKSYTDEEVRVAIAVVKNDKLKQIVVNVYCPHDYKTSYVLMEIVYQKYLSC
jgi:hypothetical protein